MLGRAPCQHFFARGAITRAEHAIVQSWCWHSFEPGRVIISRKRLFLEEVKGRERIDKWIVTRSISSRHRSRVVGRVVESLINKAAAQASFRSFRRFPIRSLVFSHAFRVKIGLIQCFRAVVDTHSMCGGGGKWNCTETPP